MRIAQIGGHHVPLDIPPGRLSLLIGAAEQPALLESGPGFGDAGRWSILTARPRLVFEADEHSWTIRREGRTTATGHNDPLDALGRLIDDLGLSSSEVNLPAEPDNPPFQGGLVGFVSYDLAPRLERLPRKAPRDSRVPVIRFALYDWAVTVDHRTGEVVLSAYDILQDDSPRSRITSLRQWLEAAKTATLPLSRRIEPPIGDMPRSAYLASVQNALEYIRAGDIFQVNLSQRFTARGQWESLSLYQRLKSISPAPFSAFLRWDDLAVISASPEWFYQTRGDRIVTRPIKGTRPRGSSAVEDQRLADELRSSPKDRAELTMIVDLERNDLGRVCQFGSVHVTDPMSIESYAQVHHLVATVEGRLRPECGPMDVIRAVFPGGSITGAPKIRAMEIIDELEPSRRSLYTGAIGYYSQGGTSAFNIPIRTLLIEGDRACYQVGGGIVADSVPELEYEETLHKGHGLRTLLEDAGA